MSSSKKTTYAFLFTVFALVAVVGGGWMWKVRSAETSAVSASSVLAVSGTPGETVTGTRPSAAVMLANMKSGKGAAELTRAQLEKFIEQENRSAVSLLLASVLCEGGDDWRKEAAERYPDDPMVAAWMMPYPGNPSVPDAAWVATLQKSDPQNALGWYYAAYAALKEGRQDEALALLTEASRKKDSHSYADEFSQAATKAWLSAGRSHLEAEAFGVEMGQGMQSHLYVMRLISQQVRDLPQEKADVAAKALLSMIARVNEPGAPAGVSEAIYVNGINKDLAWTFDMFAANPTPGATAAERQSALRKEASRMLQLEAKFTRLLPQLSDPELKQYLRRVKVEGEIKAMEWVVQTKGAAR